MNDKDFDKIFGDKLREERVFSSTDSDWEQLSTRLDTVNPTKEKDNRGRGAAWLWLLMLPILALLLWQMNDLKNQNKQLATQLTAVQSQLSANNWQYNTVVQKAQKTDTVIIYKYLNAAHKTEKKNKLIYLNPKSEIENPKSATPSVFNGFSATKTPILDNFLVSSNQKTVIQEDTTKPLDNKMAELTEKLAALDKQITDLKQALAENAANVAHLADCATKQDLLKKQLGEAVALTDSLKAHPLSTEPKKVDKSLKNNRLFVGIQGGEIRYITNWTNSLGIDIYRNVKSYQVGLKLEYALTDKLRLTAGGDFCPFSFLIYWQDKRYNLPAADFNPQKEKYLNAESKQNLLQGHIGAKYFFTEGGGLKWRPFVSAAYSMMHIKPFETKFTYQSLWGTTNREQTIQSQAINVQNILHVSGGLEYRFSKYGVAQAEAFYDKDINKTHQTFDLFGLRAALLLNIK